jgi:hypothetical protein
MLSASSWALAMASGMPFSVGVSTISAPSAPMTTVFGPTNFSGTTRITR